MLSEYDPTDETADHLAGSKQAIKAERRVARRTATGERVVAAIKLHGNGYRTASSQLRSAAERHYGSWANACQAAGLPRPTIGRPRTDAPRLLTEGDAHV